MNPPNSTCFAPNLNALSISIEFATAPISTPCSNKTSALLPTISPFLIFLRILFSPGVNLKDTPTPFLDTKNLTYDFAVNSSWTLDISEKSNGSCDVDAAANFLSDNNSLPRNTFPIAVPFTIFPFNASIPLPLNNDLPVTPGSTVVNTFLSFY